MGTIMNTKLSLIASALFLGMTSSAFGATLLAPPSPVPGNDPFPQSITVGNITSEALAKCDDGSENANNTVCGTWEDGNAAGDYRPAFSLTYVDAQTFNWSFDSSKVLGNPQVVYDPRFVVIKQSNDYDVWELTAQEIAAGMGTITTQRNDISHVSFYDGNPGTVIPLPAAGWMLIAGIGSLAALRRRRKAS